MEYFLSRALINAGIPENSLSALDAGIKTRTLDTGEFLIRQGEYSPYLYFIAEGLVKMFYVTDDGKEFVKSFIPEGSFAGSLVSQLEGAESTFSVVCLEPVKAEMVPFKIVQSLFQTVPEALLFGFNFFQTLALKKEKREFSFLCQSPEKRYQSFVANNPDLVDRITLADIARYLGITPVALSRIRGRIKTT